MTRKRLFSAITLSVFKSVPGPVTRSPVSEGPFWGSQLMLQVLEIAAVVAIALCLVRWHKTARARNSQSWETLMAKLRPEWSARELSDHFLWQEGLSATPEDAWLRMEGPKGLWVMYQNAKIMLEMADFAAKNCEGVDRLLVETLHSDAMQIRCVCSHGARSVCVHACQRGSSRECVPRRLNVYRHGSPHDAVAAGIRSHHGSGLRCSDVTSFLFDIRTPASAGVLILWVRESNLTGASPISCERSEAGQKHFRPDWRR